MFVPSLSLSIHLAILMDFNDYYSNILHPISIWVGFNSFIEKFNPFVDLD